MLKIVEAPRPRPKREAEKPRIQETLRCQLEHCIREEAPEAQLESPEKCTCHDTILVVSWWYWNHLEPGGFSWWFHDPVYRMLGVPSAFHGPSFMLSFGSHQPRSRDRVFPQIHISGLFSLNSSTGMELWVVATCRIQGQKSLSPCRSAWGGKQGIRLTWQTLPVSQQIWDVKSRQCRTGSELWLV